MNPGVHVPQCVYPLRGQFLPMLFPAFYSEAGSLDCFATVFARQASLQASGASLVSVSHCAIRTLGL